MSAGALWTLGVHPTAQVHPEAQVSPGAVVGAYSEVGAGCVLHPYAMVGPYTRLEAGCVVYPFAVIGGAPQDRKTPDDVPTRLECGPGNVFREHVTVSRGTPHGGGLTRIGALNLLMAGAHVAHDACLGDENVLANGVSLAGHVSVGDRVTFGGHAAVHQFVRIGSLALIAAHCMVTLDVPPYALVAGDRARVLGLNVVGLRRHGYDAEARLALKRALRTLYVPGARASAPEALASAPEVAVRALGTFVAGVNRGLTPRGRRD